MRRGIYLEAVRFKGGRSFVPFLSKQFSGASSDHDSSSSHGAKRRSKEDKHEGPLESKTHAGAPVVGLPWL